MHSYQIIQPEEKGYRICSRCICDTRIPSIVFNSKGECDYCDMSDSLKEEYKTETDDGWNKFHKIVNQIKKAGKGRKYDCAIGVSGGVDSSYMVHLAVELGLRPLAVHYDNTWNSSIATQNIRKVLEKLKVDLYTHVVDNKESDDIFRAFLKSGVPELDAPTDLAFAETHYRAASKFKIKYILEGHSFLEEGVSALSTMYFDGKYIKSIHKQFGSRKMKTYPLMDFLSFMKWVFVKRIKRIRPFWYIKYSKQNAITLLQDKYEWKYYGGHHLENRMSAFMHSYYLPNRYNIDHRNNSLSALVRNGRLERAEAIRLYNTPPHIEDELLEYFIKRLELTDKEFKRLMKQPLTNHSCFPTYKKRFERLRPLFYIAYKANLVPKSFYIKYTSKQ